MSTAHGEQDGGGEQPAEGSLAATGLRIERLLEACAAAGPMARERAEELVRITVDLYGAGLGRILEIAYEAGVLSDEVLDRLAADELVSGLLLVHGLHPYAVEERIARALDGVRPYLGSHGGDVELIGVTEEGVARLQLLGSCDGCPSSSVTLSLAVEGAVTAAAPEIVSIEVVEAPASSGPSVIPVDALSVRLRSDASAVSWQQVLALSELPAGAVRGVEVSGQQVVLARVGSDVYAYRDGCPTCGADLAGAALERQLGEATVVLTCRGCRAHYDIRHAGAGLDGTDAHLAPLPLLTRDGWVDVAVPAEEAVPA